MTRSPGGGGGTTNPGTGGGTPGGGTTQPDSVAPSVVILRPELNVQAAAGDSLAVRVTMADNQALRTLTVRGAFASGADAYASRTFEVPSDQVVVSDTVDMMLAATGAQAADLVHIVATVTDRAGKTNSDTVSISTVALRGRLIPLQHPGDRILDLVSDGNRLFMSNQSRNRVEVLPIGGTTFSNFRVGSEPWGMALSRNRDTLFVANSGGTNVSVVPITGGSLVEAAQRIQTPNIRLFDVSYQQDSVQVAPNLKEAHLVPQKVVVYDYSDRPQYIAQTAGGHLLYSTKPTNSAPNGTIRRRDPSTHAVEFFVDYAPRTASNRGILVNADSAFLLEGKPNRLRVYPRGYSSPVDGFVDEMRTLLSGTPARFEFNRSIEEVGLSDTTFLAVSGNNSAVAFGEGARSPGRIIWFEDMGTLFARSGDTDDLIGNASDRVVGLALNADGTLGAARGTQAYFFDSNLRLLGVRSTGKPTGGLAMHPEHTGSHDTRFTFITGEDESGSAYIDVVDTHNYFIVQRIFLRQKVTGALIAVRPSGATGALKLYGVTGKGILELDLTSQDLQR